MTDEDTPDWELLGGGGVMDSIAKHVGIALFFGLVPIQLALLLGWCP